MSYVATLVLTFVVMVVGVTVLADPASARRFLARQRDRGVAVVTRARVGVVRWLSAGPRACARSVGRTAWVAGLSAAAGWLLASLTLTLLTQYGVIAQPVCGPTNCLEDTVAMGAAWILFTVVLVAGLRRSITRPTPAA